MVDDVDGHHQVEGPGGERQAVEVGLHQVGCDRRGGGVGQARLEESAAPGRHNPPPRPETPPGARAAGGGPRRSRRPEPGGSPPPATRGSGP